MKVEDIKNLSKDTSLNDSYKVEHLGLVASTINKLGLTQRIDKLIPLKGNIKTTVGQRVFAFILNGLGFIDTRMYLFPEFLKNKPVDLLLGTDGLTADLFNDDSLGRCLDKIHEYGTTKLFAELALPIALEFGIELNNANIDTTSISLYGKYDIDGIKESEVIELDKSNKSKTDENTVVDNNIKVERNIGLKGNATPEYGNAKNKRFDLKQMTLLMATNGSNGIPLWMEPHSGNASDQKTLEEAAQRMQSFCKELENAPSMMFVGDSAMYANCVKKGSNLLWISRVPEKINLAKSLLNKENINWIELGNGYKMYVELVEYRDVKQRWALIYSQQAYDKELETLNKNITKEFNELNILLKHLKHTEYGCIKDANKEVDKINKGLKYHTINSTVNIVYKFDGKGRPNKDQTPIGQAYKITSTIEQNIKEIEIIKSHKGKFIIATNQLDVTVLPDNMLLSTYKEQSGTEKGFKFIKDNSFEIDSVFLKKPERIDGLLMIMMLCLMVYSYAQFFLYKELDKNNETILSQVYKPTNRPSMKWIYKLLDGVVIVNIVINNELRHVILNLSDTLRKVIRCFGDNACKIYGI